ncbi:MAG: DUF1294 domain-containing protein, partial [Paracoccaceae bacterium]
DYTSLTPETMELLALGLIGGLLALNLATFTAFALDKQREINGRAPLPEVLLLSLAALGGWPAAKLAQLLLRLQDHTTQFRSLLNLVALPLVVVSGLVVYETVDLWALEARVMSYVGEVTGTGPEAAAARTTPEGKVSAPEPTRFGPKSDGKVGKTVSARVTE